MVLARLLCKISSENAKIFLPISFDTTSSFDFTTWAEKIDPFNSAPKIELVVLHKVELYPSETKLKSKLIFCNSLILFQNY